MTLYLRQLGLKNLVIKVSKYMEPMVTYCLNFYRQKLIDARIITVALMKIDQGLFLRLLMGSEMSVAKVLF